MLDDKPDVLDPECYTDASPNPARDADLAALCTQLKERGLVRAVIRYCGSGDSGGVDEIDYEPPKARPSAQLEDRLRDLAEDYCPESYENNDGGYGSLTLHIKAGVAEREHYDCYEDTESFEPISASLPERLRQCLDALGVRAVMARFDGYGDSGQIEELIAEPNAIELPGRLRDELDDALLAFLPGGWENNAGGYGDVTIDVPNGRAEVDGYWRIEEASDPCITRWKWRQ